MAVGSTDTSVVVLSVNNIDRDKETSVALGRPENGPVRSAKHEDKAPALPPKKVSKLIQRGTNNRAKPITAQEASKIPSQNAGSIASTSRLNVESSPQARHASINQHTTTTLKFDAASPLYLASACCDLLHYKTAAILVAVIEIVLLAAWFSLAGVAYFYWDWLAGQGAGVYVAHAACQGALASCSAAVVLCLLIGILLEKPLFLWPHLAAQALLILIAMGGTIAAVISMALGVKSAEAVFGLILGENNLPKVKQSLGPVWPFCLAVIFDSAAALLIWLNLVVRGCYEYFLDKEFFMHRENLAANIGDGKSDKRFWEWHQVCVNSDFGFTCRRAISKCTCGDVEK